MHKEINVKSYELNIQNNSNVKIADFYFLWKDRETQILLSHSAKAGSDQG